MPSDLKAFIEGSSRRELLRKVSASLVVFDNKVGHVETGAVLEFQETSGAIDCELLARSCKELLGENAAENSILLLLPPVLFVATHQKMPGVRSESIVSALLLQAENLLPANESPLALAINPNATELSEEPVALWIRSSTMNEIFTAFAQEKLFLAAVKPRALNLGQSDVRYLDEDASTVTMVECSRNILLRWLQTDKSDLEKIEFQQQWQDATSEPTAAGQIELNDIEDFLELSDKINNQDYCFCPQGALSARRRFEKGRKMLVAAAGLVVALLFASIPFLLQSIQFRSLAASLGAQRELSFDARQDQAIVVNFENEFGPINDFPEQNIREAMFALQNTLSPNQLSSLEVAQGFINIQGTSAEPQTILQQLEQDPMFTEVAFSRATNNDRYFISLRLSEVNFDAYMVRYFSDEQ